MSRPLKYDKKVIREACRLYDEGKLSMRAILRKTGISSHSVIYFHCDPRKRIRMLQRARRWMRENPEQWRMINRKALSKFYSKKSG